VPLRERAKAALVAAGDRASYRRGTWIFGPGDPPGPAMLILHGEVDVVGVAPAVERRGEGEVIGEVSAIDGLSRCHGAWARDDVEVVMVDPLWFNLLLTEDNGLAVDLLRDLTARLRRVHVRETRGRARAG
jgi:CRP-like cAMP-binding protein